MSYLKQKMKESVFGQWYEKDVGFVSNQQQVQDEKLVIFINIQSSFFLGKFSPIGDIVHLNGIHV